MRCAMSHSVVTSMVAPAGLLALKFERQSSSRVGPSDWASVFSAAAWSVVSLSSSVICWPVAALTLKAMYSMVFQPVFCGTTISSTCGAVPVTRVSTQGFAFVALTIGQRLASMLSLIMMTEPWDD